MKKIKIICDSTCDIKRDFAEKNNIDILPITIIFEDKEYCDYYDFKPDEFYEILDANQGSLPQTSQVTPKKFLKAIEKAVSENYDEVIIITINSLASGTFQSANIAKSMYEEAHGNSFKISTINSLTYSCLISAGITKAVEMINNGISSDEICKSLNEFFPKSKAIVAVGTLDNLIKTGRIGKVIGAVGGLLNIKPIVEIGNEVIDSIDKVRGNSMMIPRLLELLDAKMDPTSPYIQVIRAKVTPEYEELLTRIKEKYSDKVIIEESIGSVITINIGSYVVGLGYISK